MHFRRTADGEGMPLRCGDHRYVDEDVVPWLEVEGHWAYYGQLRHLERDRNKGVRAYGALTWRKCFASELTAFPG